MKQLINISSGQTGFKVIMALHITNGVYLNYDMDKICFIELDGIKYMLFSDEILGNEKKPIKDCQKMKFEFGNFETEGIAKEKAENFKMNLRFHLAQKGCIYDEINYIIDDISRVTIKSHSDVTASLSVRIPLKLNKLLNIDYNEKVINAIKLMEMANKAKDTVVSFMLHLIILESLLDDDTNRLKSSDTINFINNITGYAISLDYQGNDKESIINQICSLKTQGSRNSVIKVIDKYCQGKKVRVELKMKSYKDVYNKCYNMRNNFVHNGIAQNEVGKYLNAIQIITYDVLNAFTEKL
jgi:hypothetical protein